MDIATSVNKIGEIVNLSQELNSLMWDRLSKKDVELKDVMSLYCDIAQLDVMSNIEIDSAKKEYPVDNGRELSEMKERYTRRDKKGRRILPNFFAPVSRKKGFYNPQKKAYLSHNTSMDYLQKAMRDFIRARTVQKHSFMAFSAILDDTYSNAFKCNYDQIERVIDIVQTTKDDIARIWADAEITDNSQKYLLAEDVRQKCINFVQSISFNATTMYTLLKYIEDDKYKGISRTLFSVLFGAPNLSFFSVLDASRQPRDVLIEHPLGDICIYNFRFIKQKQQQKIADFIQI